MTKDEFKTVDEGAVDGSKIEIRQLNRHQRRSAFKQMLAAKKVADRGKKNPTKEAAKMRGLSKIMAFIARGISINTKPAAQPAPVDQVANAVRQSLISNKVR